MDLAPNTYKRLLRRSESFEDTPNDVIDRLLGQVEAADDPAADHRGATRQAPAPAAPGSILPVREYWLPILSVIADAGGSAPASHVIAALEERMGDALKDPDRETLRNGEVRWRNRARFARLRMKERGLLSDTSERGRWEITQMGRAYLNLHRTT